MPSPAKVPSVFINCPFDSTYKPLFDAIVFAVFDCGFRPRSALEIVDGGDIRLDKICRIIGACGYAIHDISRTELDDDNDLPRFNMPFELGLFIGAARFGNVGGRTKKRCLILDRERYRYQKFISDIAGQDISPHADDPERIIRCVRDWLNSMRPSIRVAGAAHITRRYRQFSIDLPELATELRLREDEITFPDLCALIPLWLERFG